MENTDATIVSQTRSVAIIDRKDSTCGMVGVIKFNSENLKSIFIGYWTVIILLLIAILVVWLV
jgi:hypothetical protein